jgi:uncharacterized membrane protein YdjX (TVP38/TMEM64 family)
LDASSTERRSRLARLRSLLADLGPTAPLLLVATIGPVLGVVVVATTSAQWLPWFDAGTGGSVVAYWLCGALAAAACLLPTHATSLVAGFLFGKALGSAVAWLVVLLAAVVGYALWRRLVGPRALQALARSGRARCVHEALLGRGFWRATWLVVLLRLSPVLPFAATNLLLAAFGMRPAAFLLATSLGVLPRAAGAAIVGAELSDLDWRAGGSAWSTAIAIAATVAAVVVIGRIAAAALRREGALPGPGGG